MESSLKTKVALVTGAGRGIGKACALALAARGCRVVAVSRTRAELEATVKAIEKQGGQALAHPCDISDESAVAALFAAVARHFGPVSILVNNAAVFHRASVADHGVSEWDHVLGVNVRGVFLCSREVFRAARPACIVNVASLAGVRGTEKFPGLSSYVASKFAVVGLTESLAVEGRALKIRVNGLAPGAVDTEMLRSAAPHLKTETTPEQIAKTVVWLADDEQSAHLTGAIVEIFSNL